METSNQNSDIFLKLLEKGKTYSNNFLVILDCPDELMDYFFLRFYTRDNTEEQNEKNLLVFRFILVLAYINISIFFSRKSDLKDDLDNLMKQLPLKVDRLFETLNLDFLETYLELDIILHSWNAKSVYGYHDLVSFIRRHMGKFKIPYQTALGLWFVYNLNFTENKPTENDIRRIAPLLGSYALTAAHQTRFIDFDNILKKK